MKGREEKKKQRDPAVDFLRVIACLMVVGIHVNVMGTGSRSKLMLGMLFSDGVTIFFILMGFFFFRKGFLQTLRRGLLQVVLPGLAIMLLSYQFAPWIMGQQGLRACFLHAQFDPAAFFTDMMSWGANIRQPLAAHLWYIFNYLQLLLAYPLLRPLYPDRTEKTVGGGIGASAATSLQTAEDANAADPYRRYRLYLIVFIFANQILMDLAVTGLQSLWPVQLSPFMLYTSAGMLLMIGYELYAMRQTIRQYAERGHLRAMLVTLLLVLLLLRCAVQSFVFGLNESQDFYMHWNCAFATVMSVLFIALVLSFDFTKEDTVSRLVRLIAKVGPYTFWIYLVHYGIYHFLFFRAGAHWGLHLPGEAIDSYESIAAQLLHLVVRIPVVFFLSLAVSILMLRLWKTFRKGNAD